MGRRDDDEGVYYIRGGMGDWRLAHIEIEIPDC